MALSDAKKRTAKLGAARAVVVLLALALFGSVPPARSQIAWPDTAARIRGWQADLDTSITVFLRRDRSFEPSARQRFVRDIGSLRSAVSTLTDEQLIVRLATAVAGAHNAHTRLYLLRNRSVLRRYPVRVWWFGDDLCVVRARPEHA